MQRIDLGTHEFTACGRTLTATVRATVEPDDMPFDGDDPEDIAAWRRGDFSMVVVIVTAWFDGEVSGDDVLGGVCYARQSDIDDAIRDHNMIGNALGDLANKLESIANKLRA